MAVSLGECACLLRVKVWLGDLVLSDVGEVSCARARVTLARYMQLIGVINFDG